MGRAAQVAIGVAWRWAALYAVLCFVTQLWAGSQYSRGQGGGLDELVRWAAIFGVVAVVASAERAAAGQRVIDPQAVLIAAAMGHGLGTALAVWWFTAKGGPQPNDWWVAPASAAVCAVLWVHLAAPRVGRRS
jgi:hypothetical protein